MFYDAIPTQESAKPIYNFKTLRDVESFIRNSIVDKPISQFQKNLIIATAMRSYIAEDLLRKQKNLGDFGAFGWPDFLDRAIRDISNEAARASRTARGVVKTVAKATKDVFKEVGRFGTSIKNSVEDIYRENFGPHHDLRIPSIEELYKAGDITIDGFIRTDKVNRYLPLQLSLHEIKNSGSKLNSPEWHDLVFQVNYLLPFLFSDGWIQYNKKNNTWTMPLRGKSGNMNGDGRWGSADFLFGIYGWHNLSDEQMLTTITTFGAIFASTPEQKTYLEGKLAEIQTSVEHKSGRQWNRTATAIAASVIAVAAVVAFAAVVVGPFVSGIISPVLGPLGATPVVGGVVTPALTATATEQITDIAMKPLNDVVMKQLTDSAVGALTPNEVVLPESVSPHFDSIMAAFKAAPVSDKQAMAGYFGEIKASLTLEQKNRILATLEANKKLYAQKAKEQVSNIIPTVALITGVGVGGFFLYKAMR